MSTVTRYTQLWTLTKGANVVRVVAGGRSPLVYTFDGFTYQPASLTPSRFDERRDFRNSNQTEVSVSLSDLGVAEQDIRAGKWDRARLLIQFIDYTNLSAAPVRKWRGVFSKANPVNARHLRAEFVSLASQFRILIGRTYQADCRVQEYGAGRCQRDLEAAGEIKTGTIVSVSDNGQFEVSVDDGTPDDGYFNYGKFFFTSGPNTGLPPRVVKDQTGTGIILNEEFPYDVEVGDEFTAHRGCDRKIATCIDRDQAANFDGEYGIPGRTNLNRKFPEVQL